MFRFRLDDLPPGLRSQAERELSPAGAAAREKARQAPASPRPTLADYAPASVAPSPPRNLRAEKMTEAERRFLADVLHGQGLFEPITLKSPSGNRYTPDFLFFDGATPVLVEVKGSYRLGSEGRAHTAFMEAASNFSSIFRFAWAVREKDGTWRMKMIVPSAPESSK